MFRDPYYRGRTNQLLRLLLRNVTTLVAIGAAGGFLASLALPKLVAASFQYEGRDQLSGFRVNRLLAQHIGQGVF